MGVLRNVKKIVVFQPQYDMLNSAARQNTPFCLIALFVLIQFLAAM